MINKSRNLRGKALIEYKNSLKLSQIQREVLIGTLLGDAIIPLRYDRPTYLVKFEQKISKKAYIEHLYKIFEPFVGQPPKIRNIKGGGANDRQSVWFRTYQHPCFKFYYDIFYPQNYICQKRLKRVPKIIHKLLTPRALAYWFMDDGTFKCTKTNRDYLLCSHSFPLSDQKLLRKALSKFGIVSNIHRDKNKYQLYILKSSNYIFVQNIQQFIHPVFL
uniref:Homing endonuclease LAGLIDADG domain-containing protein n=1 Tax=Caulerpa verticillata TaxID=177082 RepID=A0A386B083_9CHLO|nr:hypothetical protein [Caulerpa verticillata]AYC65101.1 hypothetical protein [Caulerpa verticillata]